MERIKTMLVSILYICLSLAAMAQANEAPRDLELLVAVEESPGSIRIVSTIQNVTEGSWIGCSWVQVEGWNSPSEKARKTMASLLSSYPSKPIELRDDEDYRRRWPGLREWDPDDHDCPCLAMHIGVGESVSDTTIVRYDPKVVEVFPGTFDGVIRLIVCDKETDPPAQRVVGIDSVRVPLE
jgi:hypothetical protein